MTVSLGLAFVLNAQYRGSDHADSARASSPAAPADPSASGSEQSNTNAKHNGILLTHAQRRLLAAQNWDDRVGHGRGIWVSVPEQRFRIVEDFAVVWETRCSTAEKGTGFKINSFQTPLGWHSVVEKIGDGAPCGQVFREKNPTKQVWRPGEDVKEDLVLTRILVLSGEEPGTNKGGDVDSYARGIYVHGTNDEARIGTPVSHGCVRLTNDDAIAAYDQIPVGTFVLFTK